MDAKKRYITPPQIAESLGVGHRKVLAWILSGELTAVNVAAARDDRPRWAVDPEELERFKRSRLSTPAPKPPRGRKPKCVKEFF